MSETIIFGSEQEVVVASVEPTLKVDLGAQTPEVIQVLVPGPSGNDGADGLGVPAGGPAGYALVKNSAADNDASWQPVMVIVQHGADPNVARPAGAVAVYWYGTVEPVNAIDIDIWAGGA